MTLPLHVLVYVVAGFVAGWLAGAALGRLRAARRRRAAERFVARVADGFDPARAALDAARDLAVIERELRAAERAAIARRVGVVLPFPPAPILTDADRH